VGDKVLAYNQNDGSTGCYAVTDVVKNEDQKV
jgi:hypothetical protein